MVKGEFGRRKIKMKKVEKLRSWETGKIRR